MSVIECCRNESTSPSFWPTLRNLSRRFAWGWVIALTTCSPFKGMQPDLPIDQAVAIGSCFKVFLYQPTQEEQANIVQALETVCSVFEDDAFKARVSKVERWISSAEASTPGVITGPDVVRTVLQGELLPAHFISRPNVAANATTTVCRDSAHGVSIDRTLIAQWKSPHLYERADLLNTLAHEATHLVVEDPMCACSDEKPCDMRYTDEGHDGCTERYLVSYHLGDMVECHVQHERDEAAFERCVIARRSAASTECLDRMNKIWEKRDL